MKNLSHAIALCLLISGSALACDYPENTVADDLPRGATASPEEMEAAQQRVKNYVRKLEAYAACVDGEPLSRRQIMSRDRDRAISEAQDIADKMNREIRQFNRSLQLRQASS